MFSCLFPRLSEFLYPKPKAQVAPVAEYTVNVEWPVDLTYDYIGAPPRFQRRGLSHYTTSVISSDWTLVLGHKDNLLAAAITEALHDNKPLADRLIYDEVTRLMYVPDHYSHDSETGTYSMLTNYNAFTVTSRYDEFDAIY